MVRVLLIEDHVIVRRGLQMLLAQDPGIEVVAAVGDGYAAMEIFPRLLPDVTLTDLQLPRLGGAETIRLIREQFTAARFLVLTTFDGEDRHLSRVAGWSSRVRA